MSTMTKKLTADWQPLDTEPMEDGQVGGDGAGQAYSVRFGKQNADGTFAFITSYFYSVDGAARGWGDTEGTDRRFGVENMTEFRISTDADAENEVFADYIYDDECGVMVWLDEAEADAKALRLADDELKPAAFERLYHWNGERF